MRQNFNQPPKDYENYTCIVCQQPVKGSALVEVEIQWDARSGRRLAGREGYEYLCPHCRLPVYTDYWKMS